MLRRVLGRLCLVIGIATPCWMFAGANGALLPGDTEKIQGAIRGQLHALGEDDAARAFELATPQIREQMGSPENFLRVIKEEYSPIYHHLVIMFSKPEMLGESIIQMVRLTDRDSRVWLAVYSMQRDEAGGWKIDGCQLLETSSVSV